MVHSLLFVVIYGGTYHPVKGVMSAVANIHGNFAKSSLEYWMSHLTLHVVSRLVEIANARNVILARLANNVAIVTNNHCSQSELDIKLKLSPREPRLFHGEFQSQLHTSGVPNSAPVNGISFQDRRHNDHVMFASLGLQELS